jgi:uncharacterized protein (DUF433 family)
VGYEPYYEVSDEGEVKSLPRRVVARLGGTRVRPQRVLKQFDDGKGYLRVQLTDVCGVKKLKRVHRLVTDAFLGPCPEGMGGLHKDDDRGNNRLANLYYGTPADNTRDKMANGKHRFGVSLGEKHGSSRLKEEDVIGIVYSRETGLTFRAIAARYGVHEMTVQDIIHGKTWAWLTGIKRAA